MRADNDKMDRLGEGGEHPSSLAARAGASLHAARPIKGLSDVEIERIERLLLRRERPRMAPRLAPLLATLAILSFAGSVMAVVQGWRPRLPFISRVVSSSGAPTAAARMRTNVQVDRPVTRQGLADTSATAEREQDGEPRPQPASRRVARVEESSPPAPASKAMAPSEGALSIEARSLAEALARWRLDGQAEAALMLLGAHERRFPHGALAVESKVARAEILLAMSRREQALLVLDSLDLASLPRARELQTLRGELRVEAGRCQEARGDLSLVLPASAADSLGKRASLALAKCP